MATTWQGIDVITPLGRVLQERSQATADLVVEQDREVGAVSCQALPWSGGVRWRDGGVSMAKVIAVTLKFEKHRIITSDAVLTPNADLNLQTSLAKLGTATPRHDWHTTPPESNLPQVELELTASSRRIWTRESLTVHACKLGDQPWVARPEMTIPRVEFEKTDLVPGLNFQPDTPAVPRIAAEALPVEPAVHPEPVQRALGSRYQVPHLMAPKIKIQYTVEPLRGQF